jgi:hypothetical protein
MRNLIIISLLLSSCAVTPVEVTHPPAVVDEPSGSNEPLVADWSNESWSLAAYQGFMSLGGEKLLSVNPADLLPVCKNFEKMGKEDRAKVYTYLVSAMARYESSFKPEETYQENFNDVHGNPVISAGLLQISVESGRGYGCPVTKTEDLFSPTTNLNCGVRILTRWISNDLLAFTNKKGGARYWSVLRETSSSRAKILAKLKALPLCGN